MTDEEKPEFIRSHIGFLETGTTEQKEQILTYMIDAAKVYRYDGSINDGELLLLLQKYIQSGGKWQSGDIPELPEYHIPELRRLVNNLKYVP